MISLVSSWDSMYLCRVYEDGMSSVALRSYHLRFALETLGTASQETDTADYKEMLVKSEFT